MEAAPTGSTDRSGAGARQLKVFHGPSPYSDDPCVVVALDLVPEALAEAQDRCERISRACAAWFAPPVLDWGSSDHEQNAAAFLAAWSLALLNKEAGFLRAAHAFREDGRICVCVGRHDEQITLAAIQMGTELFGQIDKLTPAQIDTTLQAFWQLTRRHHPDFQIVYLMKAARAAGIPWMRHHRETRLWQFGWGRNAGVFFESEPMEDSAIGWKLARDKLASKDIFASIGAPTPPHAVAVSEADLAAAAEAIGWPCVVKPTAAGHGQGVTTDVNGPAQLRTAFREARTLGKGAVLIERQIEGELHRINVWRGEVKVIQRLSLQVMGDGEQTVRALIEHADREIEERRRTAPYLGPIAVDERLEAQLDRQGLSLDAVPDAGRAVLLSRVALVAVGASYTDVTARTHPDILAMARLLAASFGLEVCGIDFISRDISRSCAEEGAVLEINTTPGLSSTHSAGTSAEEIGRRILGDGVGRIPVTLVVVSTADCARLEERLAFSTDEGWTIGGKCGLGSYVLSDPFATQEGASPLAERAARVLRNPFASSLTVVCAAQDFVGDGLPLDRCDRVIVGDCDLDPAWREVLARCAERLMEVSRADEVPGLLSPAT